MMEGQNVPKNEPFVCDNCKRPGGYMNGHHDKCEQDYIKNVRCKGIPRSITHCQCDNLGHSWGTVVDYNKPVTDEQMQEYIEVNDKLPRPTLKKLKIKHNDPDKIDTVAAEAVDFWNFITERETNVLLWFNGKIYDSKNAVSIIKEFVETRIQCCTESDRNEVVNKIKSMTYKGIEEFDNDPSIITLENGVFNISTGELTPHTPTNLSKVLIPCSYAKPIHEVVEDNLNDNLFWNALTTICTIDGKLDEELRTNVLEMYASSFIKRQIDEISFICYGTGSNGKSVVLEYLESLIGKENVSRIPLQELADDKFASADLMGKLANIYTDIGSNALRQVDKIKNLSSGEKIRAQLKHGQGFTLIPYAKQIFSCNRFPKVYDPSNGFFRRWKILNFLRVFSKSDKDYDPKLKFILIEDQEGKNLVFSVVIGISKQLLEKGKFTHSTNPIKNRELWNANADPIQNFVTKFTIETEHECNKTFKETHVFYKETMFSIGETPLDFRQFNKEFSEHYEESPRHGKARTWLNLDFKRPEQKTMESIYDSIHPTEDDVRREW